ncbi:flagellar biosynthetic protein FliQ [Oceanibium sediminis]|uniref:flagellar biosynthetic protein FliQ n=1 Tax=Oceanibium sediminis TaxID=2026339 RepID=UPI000DD465D7|nr:flagellar biosynthetic protein FliQ [Oceanibium sediminis]
MGEAEVMDILRRALWVSFVVSAPVLIVALAVGLVIGLLQALTSIQEMTLSFVPKLAAILLAFWVSMAFSGQMLVTFYTDAVLPRIAAR